MPPKDQTTQVALIQLSLKNIKDQIDSIDAKLERHYVTKSENSIFTSELALLKKIVFGVVSIIVIIVITALVTSVIKK